MATWLLLTLLVAADSTGPSDGKDQRQFDHVRSQEVAIRQSIVEGYARSATFKEIVDTVEALSCIVYIATAVRLSDGMRGALLHNPAGAPTQPLLRVVVAANLSPEERTSIIAHELQHVIEVVSAGPVESAVAMTMPFKDLDPAVANSHKLDTEAAAAVTRKVRDELARTRPPRK